MKIFFIFVIISSCVPKSIIEKEKKFLENNKDLSVEQTIEYFGEVDDSILVETGLVMIWDNLNGKMTRMTAPPKKPLDSLIYFGKRQLRILFDTNDYKMKKYIYLDYTNPLEFK